MDVVHSLTLSIHTPYSHVQVPIPHRDNQPPEPAGGPLPSGGKDRQTAPAPEPGPASPDSCLNLSDPCPDPDSPALTPVPNDPQPHLEREPCTKEGSGTGTMPQEPQQNTSHNNTEATNKKTPTQNGRPPQMQAPGQHRHMHPP
ncbi:hypothetical protein ATANTOWER_012468 [Ataeniobius toweri]|uniref:Uncharacterized protein n=1 Tax=Ataeniobius toweri TaxID=208326 RepID=A0ABU7B6B3_9TELE|nr:hypothetical protein [Ataeniobius toweri]